MELVTKAKIIQRFDELNGISQKRAIAAGICRENCWTDKDMVDFSRMFSNRDFGKYLRENLYDYDIAKVNTNLAKIIELAHSKRFISFISDTGERKYFGIPSNEQKEDGRLNSLHHKLMKSAMVYDSYASCEDEKTKKRHYEHFMNLLGQMKILMISRVFSKEIKSLYKLIVKGIKGVALTGNVSLNGVALPKEYCDKLSLKIGDKVLVIRHPVQNLIICCTLERYTKDNTVRCHHRTIELLDGDFDGDELGFIPVNSILNQMKDYKFEKSDTMKFIHSELEKITPTKLFANDSYGYVL